MIDTEVLIQMSKIRLKTRIKAKIHAKFSKIAARINRINFIKNETKFIIQG